jgi:hypothetical protein
MQIVLNHEFDGSTIHIQFTEYQILSEKAKKSATFVADFERLSCNYRKSEIAAKSISVKSRFSPAIPQINE